MAEKSLAPKQDRSRQTLDSLLKATIVAVNEVGLDGATIPRIAKEAGVAPGSVYRRFADKDALIQEALLSILRASTDTVRKAFPPMKFAGHRLDKVISQVLGLLLKQYRESPNLLNALKRCAERYPGFDREATKLVSQNFETIVEALVSCRDLAGTRGRKEKVRFALMTAATALEIRVLEPTSLWNTLLQEDDAMVVRNLAAMMLAYLKP